MVLLHQLWRLINEIKLQLIPVKRWKGCSCEPTHTPTEKQVTCLHNTAPSKQIQHKTHISKSRTSSAKPLRVTSTGLIFIYMLNILLKHYLEKSQESAQNREKYSIPNRVSPLKKSNLNVTACSHKCRIEYKGKKKPFPHGFIASMRKITSILNAYVELWLKTCQSFQLCCSICSLPQCTAAHGLSHSTLQPQHSQHSHWPTTSRRFTSLPADIITSTFLPHEQHYETDLSL